MNHLILIGILLAIPPWGLLLRSFGVRVAGCGLAVQIIGLLFLILVLTIRFAK